MAQQEEKPTTDYHTFGVARPQDVNGDNAVDAWDEAVLLARRCMGYAAAVGIAATRHASADWWLACLQVVLSTATALFGAMGSSADTGLVTTGLATASALLLGLQRVLKPADKAAECRHAQRALLALSTRVETVAVYTEPADRPSDASKYIDDLLAEVGRITEPPVVADAVLRYWRA